MTLREARILSLFAFAASAVIVWMVHSDTQTGSSSIRPTHQAVTGDEAERREQVLVCEEQRWIRRETLASDTAGSLSAPVCMHLRRIVNYVHLERRIQRVSLEDQLLQGSDISENDAGD